MPKCKVCGYRLNDDMAKCPMCGAEAGSTIAGEISENADLPQYKCPSCGEMIVGEHRFCPNCGVNIKEAVQKLAEKADTSESKPTERKCTQCGAVLAPTVKFCPDCGAKMEEISAETEIIQTEETQSEPINEKLGTEYVPVQKPITLKRAISSYFKHALDFKGRASRSEFWYSFVCAWLLLILFDILWRYLMHSIYGGEGEGGFLLDDFLRDLFSDRNLDSEFYECINYRPGFELMNLLAFQKFLFIPYYVHHIIIHYSYNLLRLALYIPWLAVSFRRLHDTGHSGWWAFCPIVPLFWYFKDSVLEINKWGVNPKQGA